MAQSTKLTPKQSMFCKEYLVDLNATQAAIRAGYTKRSSRTTSARLLANDNIQAELSRLKKIREDKVEINAEYLLKRLVDQDQADVADLYDDQGNLKPIHDIPEVWRRGLISGLEVVELFERDEDGKKVHIGNTVKMKLADRIRVQDMIGKHVDIQAWLERQEISGDLTLSDRMKKARERRRS